MRLSPHYPSHLACGHKQPRPLQKQAGLLLKGLALPSEMMKRPGVWSCPEVLLEDLRGPGGGGRQTRRCPQPRRLAPTRKQWGVLPPGISLHSTDSC